MKVTTTGIHFLFLNPNSKMGKSGTSRNKLVFNLSQIISWAMFNHLNTDIFFTRSRISYGDCFVSASESNHLETEKPSVI